MNDPEYMRIATKYFPLDILTFYNLSQKIKNNNVYCQIFKGIYGLK